MTKQKKPAFRVTRRVERIAAHLAYLTLTQPWRNKPAKPTWRVVSPKELEATRQLVSRWSPPPTVEQLADYDAECESLNLHYMKRTDSCSCCGEDADPMIVVLEQTGDQYEGQDEVRICTSCLGRMVGVAKRMKKGASR